MKKFFDPVERATMLSSALNLDLKSAKLLVAEDRYLQVLLEQQYASTLKKVEVNENEEVLHTEALLSFIDRNRDLGVINSMFESNGEPTDASIAGYILRRARHLVGWVLRDITVDEVFDEVRHSNGVSVGIRFTDTSLNAKSRFPWSCTEGISLAVANYWGYDESYFMGCFDATYKRKFLPTVDYMTIVGGSRATTVPKTTTKRRMIAIEPTGNMFFQQALMNIMYKRLAEVGLDVKTLPLTHRRLAMYASVGGHLATLDLSNASDTVSLNLVRYLFPARWFQWMYASRCDSMSVLDKDIKLNTYATMGNATTFPVETLVFWSITCSCVMFHRLKRNYGVKPWRMQSLLTSYEDRKNVSVFGDDIICPTEVAEFVIDILSRLGFSVNTEKSFYQPGRSFRESCGGDFYHGRDVRPWFIRGPATTSKIGLEAWLYVLANTLSEKYISYFGALSYVYEKEAYSLIFKWLREVTPLVKVVPHNFPNDSGLLGLEGLRLARCYLSDREISRVGISEQGWYDFKYLRFRYPTERKTREALTYATYLKKKCRFGKTVPRRWFDYIPVDELDATRVPLRKKGEYIVARSVSTSF